MKRRISFLLFALCVFSLCTASVGAQIRDYVGIVRSTLHPDSVSYLEKLRDSLKSDGYVSLSGIVDGYIAGGFGSGFVYVAQNGNNYIITNRHVVSQAYTSSIEFEHPDGSSSKYENLKVLAIDEDIDLALLAFPDGVKPFKEGMQLDSIRHEDGEEIWSAGFPALGNQPMWQLGKGTITNSIAKVPELADPDKTILIQHSAQVDAGNSGGPLLIASKKSPGGYRVIGINTWKAVYRQATNYSIPSTTIMTFVNHVIGNEHEADSVSLLERRSSDFMNQLSSKKPAYHYIEKYISYNYVASDGAAALKRVLASAPGSVRDDILSVFGDFSPIEGMRYALAYEIEKKVSDSTGKIFVSVDSVAENGALAYVTIFSSPTNKWKCNWEKEHGLWRISSFGDPNAEKASSDKKTPDKKKSDKKNTHGIQAFSIETPYSFLVTGTCGIPMTKDSSVLWGAQMLWSTIDYLSVGMNFCSQGANVGFSKDSDSFESDESGTKKVTATIAQGIVRLQLPFRYSTISFSPFVQAGWGIGGMSSSGDFQIGSGYSLGGGILTGFGENQHIFVECAYSYRSIKGMGVLGVHLDAMNTSNIMLSFGIVF